VARLIEEEPLTLFLDPIKVTPDEKEKKGAQLISSTKVDLTPTQEIAPERNFLESTGRKLSSFARGAATPLAGAIAGGAIAGPPGAIAGGFALPAAEGVAMLLNKLGLNVGSPSQKVQSGLTKLGFPVPDTLGERSFETAGSFFGSAGGQIPALAKIATSGQTQLGRGIATELSKSPTRQLASTVPAGLASQYTLEKTDSPTLSTIAGVGAGSTAFIKSSKPQQVTKEALEDTVSRSYKTAENIGFKLDSNIFRNKMKTISSELRPLGFAEDVPTQFPKLSAAVSQLKKENAPIDYQEIKALRAIVKTAKSSSDKDESRLASELLDKFDDYMMNITAADMAKTLLKTKSGSKVMVGRPSKNVKESMQIRKEGDIAYTKLKKGEIFEDIMEMAAREPSTSSAVIVKELKKIANNNNKIKYFTKAEQAAIKKASETKNMKTIYNLFSKIAPRGNLGVTGAAVGGYMSPEIVIPALLFGVGSKSRLSSLRNQDLQSLIDLMRSGGKQNYATSPANISTLRNLSSGLLNSENQ
tara:strand:+ start:1761 stop:3347 length:1587 start_codon:yes stop_codon:yes gene_type:complete